MMRTTYFFILALCCVSFGKAQTSLGGVTLPETVEFHDQELVLNGAGVREKFFMDIYVGGLYLSQPSSNAREIIEAELPMAIKLHIVSKMITSSRMIDGVNEGFEKATGGDTSEIAGDIRTFRGFFEEKIKKGDVFDLLYLPVEGVKVYKNSRELGTIPGKAFKEALFGIWLSDQPADEDLRQGMLGN